MMYSSGTPASAGGGNGLGANVVLWGRAEAEDGPAMSWVQKIRSAIGLESLRRCAGGAVYLMTDNKGRLAGDRKDNWGDA